MNSFILLTIAQAADLDTSLWSMILKGGWLMIPIFILSLITIYILCERYVAIQKASQFDDSFGEYISDCISGGNKKEALNRCDNLNTPIARILRKGITHSDLPLNELRATLDSSANIEVATLEKGLTTLATCAGAAPMIGFLGTVIGMVQAFYDMALAGNNINIGLLSRGIYTAMITTVAGLIVGIIAYLAYNALVAKIDNMVTKMENCNNDFIEAVYKSRKK